MAHGRTEARDNEVEVDLELLEFLEADLLPDGAQSGFKEQLRNHLRELLRERGVLRQRDRESGPSGGSGTLR